MCQKGLECLAAALGQGKNRLERNERSILAEKLVFEWEIILNGQKCCYMVVREEKYVALLSKFSCLWEVTELNQSGCDNENGQQGSSCDCKTHVKAPLQLLAEKSEMLRDTEL